MDCPGAWHTLVIGNVLTNCGDGIGSDGNGDLIVAYNVMYNFGSVGFLSPSTSGKSASQAIVFCNTIFLGSDFGAQQQAIAILDNIPAVTDDEQAATATPGSVAIVGNVVYGSAFSAMIELRVLGATVVGNVFDFGGVQPENQPNPSGTENSDKVWPPPTGVGIQVVANDAVIEGNVFRNAGPPGTGASVVGIYFPPDAFPPHVSPDAIRILIAGNVFDKTIGDPVKPEPSGMGALLGVRILDNIGINPVGTLDTTLVPFPAVDATFANPYPYDAFVTISCGATASVLTVTLDGVVTGVSIPANDQESFLVKAGATIALHYTGAPSWVWVGL
ncbi:MAG TPA: hypothetical protein VJP76_07440 [Candidatus Tumulicola sp.]|nr:hypothetical protein [Candidatus Tumulicola sp.]